LLTTDITAYEISSTISSTRGGGGAVAVVPGDSNTPEKIRYTPASGFDGTDTITYTFTVGPNGSNGRVISMNLLLSHQNRPPSPSATPLSSNRLSRSPIVSAPETLSNTLVVDLSTLRRSSPLPLTQRSSPPSSSPSSVVLVILLLTLRPKLSSRTSSTSF
jgi:hypothetical protein